MASDILTFPAGESTTQAVVYSVTDAMIAAAREACEGLSADTPQGYEAVRLAIGNLRDKRVAVEKRRVELKADALAYGRKVDSEAKRLTTLLEAIEDPLTAKKKAVDDEKARVKAEAEAAKLAALEAEIRANTERIEAERKAARDAEEARIAIERAALEQERAKLADERRLADERAAAERAKADEAQRVERERQRQEAERLRVEREVLEAERRAVAEAREKAERAEFERQARLKAEHEAKAKAERDRVAAEEARVAEAERLAAAAARLDALRPDVEKVATFAAMIRAIEAPTVSTDEARAWIDIAMKSLADTASLLDHNAGGF